MEAQGRPDHASIPRRRSLRIWSYEVGFVIALTAIAVMLTATMLEIQTTATAYVVGEGHWSKAQQDAAHALHRYAADGDPEELRQVRDSLLVPLGDREARLAMEREPVDLHTARRGFLQGRNDPRDVDRLIRMYKYLRNAPYFRDSVTQWRLGDDGVLDLHELAGEIERAYASGRPDAATIRKYQDRVQAINSGLRPIETAFSESMVQGTRLLRNVLLGISMLLFLIVSWLVIVVLRSTMKRIRDSEGTFRAAFHQAAVGMLRMKIDSRIVEANETMGHILGRDPPRLAGMRLVELMHDEDRLLVAPDGSSQIDWSLRMEPTEHRFLREDGSTRWLRWTVSMIDSDVRGKERVFALIEDVSEARRLSDEMKYQASHDALTGLINRREIERRLRRGMESARTPGEKHAFLFLDLDQFKLINDTCGHIAGDQLLRQIAGVLMLHMRGNDWMGRLGGDEFAVLLEGTGLEEAVRIGQRLRRALAASTFHWEGNRFNVTCSVGIVSVDGDKLDVGHVLRAADRACYQAKEDGRNCIRVYHESDQAMSKRRDEMAWVNDIRDAVSNGRILLYAQRIETLDGRRRLNYEVLVRLVDAQGMLHAPDSFLPAAERFGEAMAIDRLVISMALDELARHPRHLIHLELCHLNISAQSIANPEFRSHVAELLDSSEVPPRKLCFEITETAAIANIAQAQEFIEDLRSRGCRIALDDFGSGLSSFAYLKNLPVDILKIDGVFVRDIANNSIDPVLVRSICEMARSLGKVTVAEWVEDRRVLALLKELGVDQAQGFGIHEPCALVDLIKQGLPPRRSGRP